MAIVSRWSFLAVAIVSRLCLVSVWNEGFGLWACRGTFASGGKHRGKRPGRSGEALSKLWGSCGEASGKASGKAF